MAKDLIQLATRQEQLSAFAEQIRASRSNDPAVMLILASTLARLAQLETEISGKEIHIYSEQTDDDLDLPF